MPPSVLHVLPTLDPRRGGPVSAVTALVRGLLEAGVPAAVAVPGREARRAAGLPVVPCATWPVPRGPLLRLPATAPLPGPVVVHVHGLASLVPWSPFVARRAWATAVVGTLHGVLDWRTRTGIGGARRLWHERLDVPLLRRLDAVHATRPSEVESARAALDGRPAPTLLPWTLAGESPAPPAPPSRPRTPFLLAVGRLHPIKGLERLLTAVARLAPARRPRVVLAGTGDRATVEALAAHARGLGIRAQVELAGFVEGDALRALYAEAAALVLPSRYENFGMVVVEALRAGCPVIAARETPWAALDAAGAGASVDADDPDAFAAALGAALDADRPAAAARARALHARDFAPAVVVPRFVAWYEGVVRRASESPPP